MFRTLREFFFRMSDLAAMSLCPLLVPFAGRPVTHVRGNMSPIVTINTNTSCNRGWLQLFTHIVCGTFTVTSFIVIIVVTLRTSGLRARVEESRCQLTGCRVICTEAPFYEEHEDDIVLAVMAAEVNCPQVFLTLHEPSFTNESLPTNWLPRLRPVVVEIGIIGGNLHHIPQDAFSVAFARHLRILFLEKITITSWTQYTLLGLANLENIFIKNCNIVDIQESALSAVSETLSVMTIVQSGQWDPKNLTGSTFLPQLTTIDMTSNDFGAMLRDTSFTKIKLCKSLYLSSSRISFIGSGAFDTLVELEYLNLNDNLLKHLEPGLFDVIIPSYTQSVKLNLVNNQWHCNCSNSEIIRLTTLGVLIVDPVCYSPTNVQGKTFSEFVTYCESMQSRKTVSVDMTLRTIVDKYEGANIRSLSCVSETTPDFQPIVVSPFRNYPCSVNVLNYSFSQSPAVLVDIYETEKVFWVKPNIVLQGGNFTMIELSLSATEGYGLIWYQNSCLNEVFCVNVVPETIRLYNVDLDTSYTFCPVVLTSGTVPSAQCIAYISSVHETASISRPLLFPFIAVGCIFFGALILYMLIRKYPYLLKGSKRLLFVKHKTVDALVLPPKLPLREVLSDPMLDNSKDLLDISAYLRHDFKRSSSVRSGHSCAPSYISAVQPTEEQLADWRFKHPNEKIYNHYATISTINFDTPVSLSSDNEHLYLSIEDVSPIINITDPFSQNFEYENVSIY